MTLRGKSRRVNYETLLLSKRERFQVKMQLCSATRNVPDMHKAVMWSETVGLRTRPV